MQLCHWVTSLWAVHQITCSLISRESISVLHHHDFQRSDLLLLFRQTRIKWWTLKVNVHFFLKVKASTLKGWNPSLLVIHTHPSGRTGMDFAYHTKILPSIPVTSSPQSVLWRGSDLLPSPRIAESDSENPAGFVSLPSFSMNPAGLDGTLCFFRDFLPDFFPHLQWQLAEILQCRSQIGCEGSLICPYLGLLDSRQTCNFLHFLKLCVGTRTAIIDVMNDASDVMNDKWPIG